MKATLLELLLKKAFLSSYSKPSWVLTQEGLLELLLRLFWALTSVFLSSYFGLFELLRPCRILLKTFSSIPTASNSLVLIKISLETLWLKKWLSRLVLHCSGLPHNSWMTSSISHIMYFCKHANSKIRQPFCSHGRPHIVLDPSHSTECTLRSCCWHGHLEQDCEDGQHMGYRSLLVQQSVSFNVVSLSSSLMCAHFAFHRTISPSDTALSVKSGSEVLNILSVVF